MDIQSFLCWLCNALTIQIIPYVFSLHVSIYYRVDACSVTDFHRCCDIWFGCREVWQFCVRHFTMYCFLLGKEGKHSAAEGIVCPLNEFSTFCILPSKDRRYRSECCLRGEVNGAVHVNRLRDLIRFLCILFCVSRSISECLCGF